MERNLIKARLRGRLLAIYRKCDKIESHKTVKRWGKYPKLWHSLVGKATGLRIAIELLE